MGLRGQAFDHARKEGGNMSPDDANMVFMLVVFAFLVVMTWAGWDR